MPSPTQEFSLKAYEDQIDQLEAAAKAAGADSPEYEKQLDEWLDVVRAQLGGDNGSTQSSSAGATGRNEGGRSPDGPGSPGSNDNGHASGPSGSNSVPAGRSTTPTSGGATGNGAGPQAGSSTSGGGGTSGQSVGTPTASGVPGAGSPAGRSTAPGTSGTPGSGSAPAGSGSSGGNTTSGQGGAVPPPSASGSPTAGRGRSPEPAQSGSPSESGTPARSTGAPAEGGSTPDTSAPNSPTASEGSPNASQSGTPTESGVPEGSTGSPPGTSTPPSPDVDTLPESPSIAASADEIAHAAGQDAANAVTGIAEATGASIARSSEAGASEAGASIAASLEQVGANAAKGVIVTGGSAAAAATAATAAVTEAAAAVELANKVGGVEAARGVARLAASTDAAAATRVAASAREASQIGQPVGTKAAQLTVQAAEAAAQHSPPDDPEQAAAEAEHVAEGVASVAKVSGARAAAAVRNVAGLGSDVAEQVVKSALDVRKVPSGSHGATEAAEATSNAAIKANERADGGLKGRDGALEIATMTAEAAIQGGSDSAQAINTAFQYGGWPTATAMNNADLATVGVPAFSLLNSMIAARCSPQQIDTALEFVTKTAQIGQQGDTFIGAAVGTAEAIANSMSHVLQHGGSFDEAWILGNTIEGFFANSGRPGVDAAENILQSVAGQGGGPAEQVAALEGAQEATEIAGPGIVTQLQTIAEQGGYKGIESAMKAIETAAQVRVPRADIPQLIANAAALRVKSGSGVADAYILGMSEGGSDGAAQVMRAIDSARANQTSVSKSAWDAADAVAEANQARSDQPSGASKGLGVPVISRPGPLVPTPTPANSPAQGRPPGGSQGPLPGTTQPPPSSQSANLEAIVGPGFANHQILIQNYTKLINDLQSGAGKDTIQADARDVAKAAFKDGNIGTGETAIVVGSSFKPDGSLFYTPSSLVDILRNVDPQTDRGRTLVYGGLGPLDQAYMTLASDVASGADTDTIKQDADTLWGTAVANGHPALGNVALDISRTVGSNSYSQDGSLMALMNMPPSQPDPAEHGFGSPTAPDTPAAGTPTNNTPTDDETKAYQTLVDDLNNGSDSNTITHDTLNLASIADDKQDYGLLEAALIIRRRVQYGTLNPASDIVGLQMAAPGSDGAKTPMELQWAPPNSAI